MTDRSPISRLTAASYRHPWRFLAGALLVTIAGAWLASRLEIRSSFEELLPPDLPSVRHAKELARRVGGDGTVLVLVESLDGPAGLPRAEAMASRLGDEYLAMGPQVIRSVESNLRPVERWYTDHWPLFLGVDELKEARDKLVSAIGQAKARVNPLLGLLGEDEAQEEQKPIVVSEPLLDPDQPAPRARVAERFARYPDGYMVHPDHRSVTVVVRPTGTSLGVGEARALVDRMRGIADRHRDELAAQHLRVGLAGSFPIMVAEYEAIVGDVFVTLAVVLVLVLGSVLLYFRDLRHILALGAALMVAIAATFGLTWLAIGYLNTQTAFLGSIVAGNGINYGIVYLARLGQLRRRGVPLDAACQESARDAFTGTLLASLGTAVSFGVLLSASNRGFKHFGFIGGVGMLVCWAATFALVPALLAAFERVRPARYRERPETHAEQHPLLERLFARPRAIITLFAVLTAASAGIFLRNLPDAMERNLDNLSNEVKGNPELRRDNDRANAGLGTSISGSIALLPSQQAAEGYCHVIGERARTDPALGQMIQGCETVASVVPDHQDEKLALLAEIRDRLTDRVLDRLPPRQAARAREIRADLAAQRPVTVEQAPQVLVDRFREKDGTVGRIAFVRATAAAHLERGPNLRAFADAIRNVKVDGGSYDAAGESIVLSDLLSDIEREGPRTTLLSFLGVCLVVVVFFRFSGRSVVVLTTLTVGVALMAGWATLAGIKINFFNFIAYPITFGIAVDYGANIVSRIDVRRRVIPALAEVGPAVVLCSWTTIVGYGSLIISINRALRSFGWYAMLGEFTTLVAALLLVPAFDLVFPPAAVRAGAGPADAAATARPAVEERPDGN